jgi:hypothetical protein
MYKTTVWPSSPAPAGLDEDDDDEVTHRGRSASFPSPTRNNGDNEAPSSEYIRAPSNEAEALRQTRNDGAVGEFVHDGTSLFPSTTPEDDDDDERRADGSRDGAKTMRRAPRGYVHATVPWAQRKRMGRIALASSPGPMSNPLFEKE